MQRMLIMRHGEAAPGSPDHARQLTPRGVQEAETMATWLARRVAKGELPMPRLYASPYVRAQQTAQALCDALGIGLETLDFITPDDAPATVGDWLLEQVESAPIMLVSHMPLVGNLTSWLVEGSHAQGVDFLTAAIAELKGEIWAAGCAQLVSFTQPSQLASG